jgi:hypothetical protein
MKIPQKSIVNRYGFRVTVGATVKACHPRGGHVTGKVESIDTRSSFAKAYGAQVKVGPYSVTAADCSAL